MTLEELQNWISKNLFKNNNEINASKISGKAKWIDKNNKDAKESIIYYTSFLSQDSSYSRRIWHIVNNIFYIPECEYCGNETEYTKFNKGYKTFCSKRCMSLKGKEKFKEKYGDVESPLQIKEFNDKVKETKKERYGDENFTNTEKRKQTCLERYGVESIAQVEEVKEKKCQTNLKRYGVKHPLLNKEVKGKALNTLKEKYNIEEDITNPFEIEEIKEKSRNTHREKYGIEHNSQKNLVNIEDFNKEFIENNFIDENYHFKLKEFQEYFNISYSHSYIKLKELGVYFEQSISREEESLQNYIKSISEDPVISKDRSFIYPWELDVFISERRLAIEYNGLYWHSELINEDRYYHLKKTELCENNNVQLIHVFEHNWIDLLKRDIVKSMISGKLGKNNKINARDCYIKEIDNYTKNIFLDRNHIQGRCQSSVNIGLIQGNELISVMCFCKSRFNKNYTWELIRFCNLKYNSVIGGASKLLNYFMKNYDNSIITYADRTYSNGDLYEKLGFKKLGINNPKYHYFKNGEIINRMNAQKKNLPNLLENFNPKLTEWENMKRNGYNRFWDCGTITYII